MHPIKDATFELTATNKLSAIFQSMHPIKDATQTGEGFMDIDSISIHAPYKGCNLDFIEQDFGVLLFQSMHPIKDATMKSVSYSPF